MPPLEKEARREWFRAQILPLEPELHQHARRYRLPGMEAEDLVHEVFARAIATEAWREVRDPAAFVARILRNLVYDQLRRRRIVAIEAVADLEQFGLADQRPGPEAGAVTRDELRRLQQVIAELPPMCRRVFTLRKIHDLPIDAIAVKLGLSVSTVEKHIVKGLRICSERLASHPRPATHAQPVSRRPWQNRQDRN